MSKQPSVLITGPIGRTEAYVAVAAQIGWQAQAHEYIEVRPKPLDLAQIPKDIDALCITSKHASPALEDLLDAHRETALFAVGEHTTDLILELGFESVADPASNAKELATDLIQSLPPNSRLIWPRGSLSDQLAQDLRAAGHRVHDPIVYETTPCSPSHAAPDLKDIDAVFLASPSGVSAFIDRHRDRLALASIDAVAIGRTTADALEATPNVFRSLHVMATPTPIQLAQQLRQCALDTEQL